MDTCALDFMQMIFIIMLGPFRQFGLLRGGDLAGSRYL